jgi:hypothetical protein
MAEGPKSIQQEEANICSMRKDDLGHITWIQDFICHEVYLPSRMLALWRYESLHCSNRIGCCVQEIAILQILHSHLIARPSTSSNQSLNSSSDLREDARILLSNKPCS